MADAKVFELKKRFGFNEDKIKAYLKGTYLSDARDMEENGIYQGNPALMIRKRKIKN